MSSVAILMHGGYVSRTCHLASFGARNGIYERGESNSNSTRAREQLTGR